MLVFHSFRGGRYLYVPLTMQMFKNQILIYNSPNHRLHLPSPRSQPPHLRRNLRYAVRLNPPRTAVIRRIRVHGSRTDSHLFERGEPKPGPRQMDDQDLRRGRRILFPAPISRYVCIPYGRNMH